MSGAPPSAATFEALAVAALNRLPEPFAQHLRDIVIRVEEFADAETLQAMDIESEWDLTGLYHGLPLTDQSVWSSGDMPPQIVLYRQPLLAEWCETGVALEALITHVVVHEIGHHFGLSDNDMHTLEQQVI
ncbi:metallopeptidase family protein [Croceicoccus bisphenolivorans]|uniref:metallopeptidase family protein n=1 Tax=Croceicoccus bisphenolivorans TaxID=1783232 RepID=UPI000A4D3869